MKINSKRILGALAAVAISLSVDPVIAQDEAVESVPPESDESGLSAAEEMARKLQNPLANIKAIMTDNAFGFNTGTDNGTSYGFQIQPVYAMDFEDSGFTFIPRAVIPILGLEPGTDAPPVGQPQPGATGSTWGLGDIVVQSFFAPHVKSAWKYGFGPQISFGTATDARLRGPNWGAGAAGVVTGSITPNLSFSGILGNMWSFDGNFSTLTFQPITFYNFASLPGTYVGYNAVIAADWKAPSGNTWTLPLGLSIGKTFDVGGGHGFDISGGPYYNVVRPDGAADWQFRFGINWLFP